MGSLNIRIYSQNKNGKRKRKFFPTETATEKCSLGRAAPQFSKCKERLLIILAKSLAFHCTSLFSNKNIFTHLATLLRIPSYNFVTILTFAQQKFESFRRGESTFLCFGGGSVKKVKKGKDKIFKIGGGGQKGWGGQDFFQELEGETDLHCERFFIQKKHVILGKPKTKLFPQRLQIFSQIINLFHLLELNYSHKDFKYFHK